MVGRWEALSSEIDEARSAAPPSADQVKNQLLVRLKRLAEGERPRCMRAVQGWLRAEKKRGGAIEVLLARSTDATDSWQNPAISLKNLRYLEDGATLRLAVTLNERSPKGIRAYTVALEGKLRA